MTTFPQQSLSQPPVTLYQGDVVCHHGTSLFSRLIRWATSTRYHNAPFNHISLVTKSGNVTPDGARITEALWRVEEDNLYDALLPGETILVFRPKNLTDEDREKVVEFVQKRLGQKYAWGKIVLFLFDSLLTKLFGKDIYVFRRLFNRTRFVCSSLVGEAFLSQGYSFGQEAIDLTPDSMFTFMINEPSKYLLVLRYELL